MESSTNSQVLAAMCSPFRAALTARFEDTVVRIHQDLQEDFERWLSSSAKRDREFAYYSFARWDGLSVDTREYALMTRHVTPGTLKVLSKSDEADTDYISYTVRQ